MFYVNTLIATFDITLTLGSEDTENPSSLALGFLRKGTNEVIAYDVPTLDIIKGVKYITIVDIPTSIFEGTGQYIFTVYDDAIPSALVEIESGLCIVTTTPITKTTYGTDRERGEYKGHI